MRRNENICKRLKSKLRKTEKKYHILKLIKVARWAKNDDSHQKYDVFKNRIFEALINTCKKHSETILLNLPVDKCEIQGKHTVVYSQK